MKYIFTGILIALLLLSGVAVVWQPRDADKRVKVVWCSDDNPVRRGQIELFNALNPKYRVVLDPQNGLMEKVIVQSLADVGPDVFDCYTSFQLASFVRSGVALDLTDEMRRRGVYAHETWECVHPMILYNERLYGYPDNANALAMWYNKKIFREEGVPFPEEGWTWDDCIAIAKKLTVRDNHGRPVRFGLMMEAWDWRWAFLGQWGGGMYSPEGTRCMLDSPEACAAMQAFQDLMLKHGVCPTFSEDLALASAGGWGTGTLARFGAGRSAMAIGGRWWLCILRNESFKETLELGAVSLPRGPSTRTFGYGRSTLVNSKSKNIEGALAFIEYLHSREWNQLINQQADALGPVKKYHYGEYEEAFLHNAEHPEEDYNLVWRTAIENSVPEVPSPFVNAQLVDRLLLKQGDMVRAGVKSGAEAMRSSAKEINREMVETLKRDPERKARYDMLVAQGAPKAWDDEADAP